MGNERTDPQRERRYRTLYNISVEEYEQILDYQGGGCAICGRPPKTIRLSVDHDHATGAVRGLLCHQCNRWLKERVTVEWLTRASQYMTVYPTQSALGYVPIGRTGRVTRKRRRKN
jgi:hypothetical protein